jgi:hypothetical protein
MLGGTERRFRGKRFHGRRAAGRHLPHGRGTELFKAANPPWHTIAGGFEVEHVAGMLLLTREIHRPVASGRSKESGEMDEYEQVQERKLESRIRKKVIEHLTARGWHVERMPLNACETGTPGLYCHHQKWGQRWVEVKRPGGSSFTRAQKRKWPVWEAAAIGIWVLTAATQEQFGLLFGPPNWREFLRPSPQAPIKQEVDVKIGNQEQEGKPEAQIQRELVAFIQARGWLVERMLANAYQTGIPDLYCYCRERGERWIEVKRADQYSFTLRQRQKWPVWDAAGIGIWILTAATEGQYVLLFKPPNWRAFWRESFRVPSKQDVDAMIDEMAREYEQSKASG